VLAKKPLKKNTASRKTARKMFVLATKICSYLPVSVVIIGSRGKSVFHNWLNPQFEALLVIERRTTQYLLA